MAKPSRVRPLPRTPKQGAPASPTGPAPVSEGTDRPSPSTRPATRATPARANRDDRGQPGRGAPAAAERDLSGEPAHLVRGTHCVAGHERGKVLDSGRGPLPTRRAARIGFGLAAWCTIGLILVLDPRWVGVVMQLLVVWLVFCAVVQWRAGHRRRCWATRTWRIAWGRIAPGSQGSSARA